MMAITPKRPGPSGFAADRKLIALAKTLKLTAIVKKDRTQTRCCPQEGDAVGPIKGQRR